MPPPNPQRRRIGCGLAALLLYLALLGASALVRWSRPPAPPSRAGVEVAEVGGVELAYRRWRPSGAGPGTPVLVLLHGSPGSSRDFLRLGPELGSSLDVIAPDLPGFGASTRQVPDYSIRAHAGYVRGLLAALGIERAHVLGFSMGGGVALELAFGERPAVASLTLLSAIGVQELELLGDARVNHAIHGAQLAGLWLLREAVPHFGLFDGGMLSREYARNFYDSDQRPLRGILARLEIPTLILHGEHDILVPVEAAREHHRLVPQSELVLFEENHFMVFEGGERLRRPIADFVARVEAGTATRRAAASPARLAAAAEPFDARTVPRAAGATLLVLFALLALATLVSEDLACIAAGMLVAQGRMGFLAATLACFSGIVGGDLLLYAAGRFLGRPWLARAPLKWWVRPEAVERGERWFRRKGAGIVLASRFMPGTRLATYVAAGVLKAGFVRFSLWFALAAALWTPLLVGFAAWAGQRAFDRLGEAKSLALGAVSALALLLLLAVRLLVPLFSWHGRRRLYGSLQRKLRWEFWPPWAFYPPVLVYVLWLALKHRSLTLFTASNPGMPASGFIGESKGDILDRLAPAAVARYRRLPAGLTAEERLAAAHAFLAEEGLSLPLVVKPDAGQRGLGVCVVRSDEELDRALSAAAGPCLVQEYIAGAEFGVFYVRLPGEERGRVFSITHKILPQVVGDGRRTIEELILADDRAVCAAGSYFERLGARTADVAAAGEVVRLTDLGTHCRGAIFLDGGHLKSPELETAIEVVSRSFEGFFFGRYDLRVPSAEALLRGEGIKVLELNGVTSEATHIYDPKLGLFAAYRILFEQWRLAFEIGRQNRERGVEPEGIGGLLRRIVAFRRQRG